MTHENPQQSPEEGTETASRAFGRVLGAGELIELAIEDAVQALGFEVVAVDWAGAPRHRVVRVYIDRQLTGDGDALVAEKADGDDKQGISLDEITRMSPVVSNALDAAEAEPESESLQRLLKNGYTLEVSSPGIERPLAKGEHFTRFTGRRISVRTFEPLETGSKQRGFHGYIKAYEPDALHPADPRGGHVVIDEADGAGILRIPLAAIKRAHLVYED